VIQAPPKWAAIRAAFPGIATAVYLNTGTVGIRPRPVLDRLLSATERLESGGHAAYPEITPDVETARAGIAALIGSATDDIGLCGNATDAVNWVTAGLDWHPGDEVLLSSQEHPAMLWPWTYLSQRRGIVLKRFEVSDDPHRCVASIKAAATNRTRVIATSHVSSETGIRVPIEAIGAYAAQHGILTLIDGAQAVGNIPVDVTTLGCDFYVANGHKWICGPSGTGFLWARPDRMALLWPAHVGAGSASQFDTAAGLTLHAGGKRFEYGTRDYARWSGMVAALDWLAALGGVTTTAIRDHELAAMLRTEVMQRSGWTLLTPPTWERSSALTTFTIDGHNARALQQMLQQRNPTITTRVVPEFNALRISTHYYNDESDITTLLCALDDVTR